MDTKGKIMITCYESTYLISKKQEDKLSLAEQLQLSMHLMFCKYCNRFSKQTTLVTKSIKQMNRKMKEQSVNITLTQEQKQKIRNAMNKQQKNNK